MRRAPLFVSFLLFVALCGSLSYWVLQSLQPPARPMVAPPDSPANEVQLSTAAVLLGGTSRASAAASDYQLSGIIMAARPAERIAILASTGKAPRPYRLHAALAPGIRLAEIGRDHVVFDQQGVLQRIDLIPNKKLQVGSPSVPPANTTTDRYVPLGVSIVPPDQNVGTISASPAPQLPGQ